MEVLKSATTPNCATWTLFSGMTSLTPAKSLSRCLNLQATCLLVSINLPKVLCAPPFQREEWTSHLPCCGFQVHQLLHAEPRSPVPMKHFFTADLRCNFSWCLVLIVKFLGKLLLVSDRTLHMCSSKTAQTNVHSFAFQPSSNYNVRLWSRKPIWVPLWSYCGTWSLFRAKTHVERHKTQHVLVFWAAWIILAKLMINRQINLML